MHRHLPRLKIYWYALPLFFITTSIYHRQCILADRSAAEILLEEWHQAFFRHGWCVGRYVIMPDHVHFLCTPARKDARTLSRFMQEWKQWTSKRLIRECGYSPPVWQAEFFDHVVRSPSRATQIEEYIVSNPVRAGLVEKETEWPWQGEIYSMED
jgi:putative transposase